jgi:ABC-type uncharacterized transport system YnjBCD ATPase subunit
MLQPMVFHEFQRHESRFLLLQEPLHRMDQGLRDQGPQMYLRVLAMVLCLDVIETCLLR